MFKCPVHEITSSRQTAAGAAVTHFLRHSANPHRRLMSWCCCLILKKRNWGTDDTASWTHSYVEAAASLGFKLAVCSRVWLPVPFPASCEETFGDFFDFMARLLSYFILCIVLLAPYTVIWEFFSSHVSRSLRPQSPVVSLPVHSFPDFFCGVPCRSSWDGCVSKRTVKLPN